MASTVLASGTAADQATGSLWRYRYWLLLVVLPVLLIAGGKAGLVSNFQFLQLSLMIVYAIAVLGLILLTGFNGQISLGHGAFFAVGAYTAAILIDQAGLAVLGDAAGGGARLLRRRLPVRAARAATRRPLPGACHLRARRGRAADPEVPPHRAAHQGRDGHQRLQVRSALRASAQHRPVDVPGGARRRRAHVLDRAQPARQPHRARADRHPRPSDGREHHGRQRRPLQGQ